MKKSFKKEIFLILCILLVSLFACVFDTKDDSFSNELVGTWVLSASNDTISETQSMIFKADSSFIQTISETYNGLTITATTNGNYKFNSNVNPKTLDGTYSSYQGILNHAVVTVNSSGAIHYYYKIESSKLYLISTSSYTSSSSWDNAKKYTKQ